MRDRKCAARARAVQTRYRALPHTHGYRRCCAVATAAPSSWWRPQLQIPGTIPLMQQGREPALARIHTAYTAAIGQLFQRSVCPSVDLRRLAVDEKKRARVEHLRFYI